MLDTETASRFHQPIFIVSSPRSASSLLFQTLAQSPSVYTIGGESHNLIESVPGLHPGQRGWDSNRLSADDADPTTTAELSRRFYRALRNRDGRTPTAAATMIEKTPKNSLRVPFLAKAFPRARFIYLYRDPRETISSMMEAWATGRFRTYPQLPEWPGLPWSLLLVPGWRDLRGLALAEIVAHQWARTTAMLVEDLSSLAPGQVVSVSSQDFLAAPQSTVQGLCTALGLHWDRMLPDDLPFSPTVVSPPRPEKWRRNEDAINAVRSIVAEIDSRAKKTRDQFRLKPASV